MASERGASDHVAESRSCTNYDQRRRYDELFVRTRVSVDTSVKV